MRNKKLKIKHSKERTSKKNKTHVERPKPYTPIKMKLFQMPDPFGNLTREQRLEVLIEFGKKSNVEFEENFRELKDWFIGYNALYLLSFCLFYFFASEEGVDKEAIYGKLDFYPHYLELLQALALMQNCSPSPKPLLGNAEQLKESITKVMDAYRWREFANLPKDIGEKEFKKRYTIAEIRSQTVAVRNSAFFYQIINVTKKLFSKISKTFEDYYQIDPLKLIDALLMKSETINLEYNAHLFKNASFYKEKNFDKMWAAYAKAFCSEDINSAEERSEMKRLLTEMNNDLDYLKKCLITHSDLLLSDFLTLSASEMAAYYGDETKRAELNRILNHWSLSFGDLANANPEHFILDNPVLKKPFIKLSDDSYFSAMFGIVYHLIPNIMELLVKEIGAAAIQKYQKAKSQLLEEETRHLFETYFPNAHVFQGSEWLDPASGKKYENDLLVIIERFAFVIECKSSAVDAPARRGAEYRIIDTLKNWVVDAAEQANRFIRYLSNNPSRHEFSTGSGLINRVDNSQVNYYIPLSVTFESLGTVSANLKQCVEADLIKGGIESFIPSICLTDLEVVFATLENEIERIHYLSRRSQIERDVKYTGDEIDLLAFYLDTGFNLGADEKPGNIRINLLMKSKELVPYFLGKERGINVIKPRCALTRWWRDTINYLIERKPAFWTEMGYVLLNVPKAEQQGFERKFKNLQARIKLRMVEHQHNWVILETLPENRSYIITGFPYSIPNSELRNEIIRNQILNRDLVTDEKLGALCIGISVNEMHYPYSILVFVPKEFILES